MLDSWADIDLDHREKIRKGISIKCAAQTGKLATEVFSIKIIKYATWNCQDCKKQRGSTITADWQVSSALYHDFTIKPTKSHLPWCPNHNPTSRSSKDRAPD